MDKTGKYTISATTIDNAGNSSTETKVIEVKNEEEKTSTDKENDNKISNVDVKEQDSDVADSILPQTGSQTEIILAILVVGTISLARVIYVYRNVKNIKY